MVPDNVHFAGQSGHAFLEVGIALDVAAAEVGAVLHFPCGCRLLWATSECHQRLAAGSACRRHTALDDAPATQTVPQQVQHQVDRAMRGPSAVPISQP